MLQAINANVCRSLQNGIGGGVTCTALRQTHPVIRARSYSQPTIGESFFSEEDHEAARKWLDSLDNKTIPHKLREVTYSRSSGPGGQNVNKCVLALVFCHEILV